MEHIELALYLFGYFVTVLGAWFNLKTTVKVNATKMITSVDKVTNDYLQQEAKILSLSKDIDKTSEDIIQIRLLATQYIDKDFLRAEHYTKDEVNQHIRVIQDGQLQNKELLDKIHDNLLGLMKSSNNIVCQS